MTIDREKSLPVPGSNWEKFVHFIWYIVIGALWLPAVLLWQDNVHSMKKTDYKSLQKRVGQIAVLTGGTRGIGREVLKILLQLDYHVVFGARSIMSGTMALNDIRMSGVKTGRAKCILLDLRSLKSVRKFAENVLKEVTRIDLLINNAGVLNKSYEQTEDGYEVHFQVNYLSHFLLTQVLLPKMKATGLNKSTKCRVINVSSTGHLLSFAGNIAHVPNPRVYSTLGAYADSKLCQVLFTKYQNSLLQSEGANVAVFAVHPGQIVTNMWADMPFLSVSITNLLESIFRSVETGADVVMYAATSQNLESLGGNYIVNHKIHQASRASDDLNLQKLCWDLSQSCIEHFMASQ